MASWHVLADGTVAVCSILWLVMIHRFNFRQSILQLAVMLRSSVAWPRAVNSVVSDDASLIDGLVSCGPFCAR